MSSLKIIAAYHDNVAVQVGRQTITYYQFYQDIQYCQNILGHRFSPGEIVGIWLENDYHNWVAHLAAWELDLKILSLRPGDRLINYRPIPIKYLVIDSKNHSHYSDQATIEIDCEKLPSSICQKDVEPLKPVNFQTEKEVVSPNNVGGRIFMTSGTTGSIKSVFWSKEKAGLRIAQVSESLQLSHDSTVYSLQHISTTGGFRYPIACWLNGGKVLLSSTNISTVELMSLMHTSNVILLTPNNLKLVLKASKEPWPNTGNRHLIVAGGRLPLKLRDQAYEMIATEISLAYGSTEAGSVASGSATHLDRDLGAVGYLRDGVELQIVDEHDEPLPFGTAGQVRIKTPYMVHEYMYQDSSAEAVKNQVGFNSGWFYPGDEGVLDSDNFLSISGRTSDVVNIGGAKFNLISLEIKLLEIDGIEDICLVPVRYQGEDLIGVLIVENDIKKRIQIKELVKEKMPSKIMHVVIYIDQISRNQMGKVQRKMMAEKAQTIVDHHE